MRPFAELTSRGQVRRLRHLAQAALADYGLEHAQLQLLLHGDNTTFRVDIPQAPKGVDTDSPYVSNRFLLRVHRPNYLSAGAVASELTWLKDLRREAGLTVPEAVSTPQGQLLTSATAPGVPEPRICTLMRWLPGQFCDTQLHYIEAIGRLMAQLHQYAAGWLAPDGFTRPCWDWNGLFGTGAGYSTHGDRVWELTPLPYRELFQKVGDRVRAVMDQLGTAPEDFGLIHADLHLGNILFFGRQPCPIDFADCGFSYWGYDMAILLSYYSQDPDLPLYREALFNGYAQVRPLPRHQLDHLETFMAARYVPEMLWAINRAQDHPVYRQKLAPWLKQVGASAQYFLDAQSRVTGKKRSTTRDTPPRHVRPRVTDETLAAARKVPFWQSLCPHLTLSANPFLHLDPPYAIGAIEGDQAMRQIVDEGYFYLPSVIPAEEISPLAKGVSAVVEAGFPAPFALVYDEVWRLLARLTHVLAPILGADYVALPDFWLWHVDRHTETSGWVPHRDYETERDVLRPDGRPTLMTVWIPFSDATPLNSCIYVLPNHLDPNYPDNLRPYTVPQHALQAIRALPAPAGSVLGWNQYLLHWGSSSSTWATQPRISIGIYFQSGDVDPYELPVIDLQAPLSLNDRLGIIGHMIVKYNYMYGYPNAITQLSAHYDHMYQTLAMYRRNRPSPLSKR
ncbi:MAG: hypothetical protein ETSY2_12105 [Candidatus Entotheonella gemina]|uniref:Aminoglycoside phosphotransferase domain-containing protein n=1 Tax=Candidatus Entotheonella gemina TaxID=1429439 RepID=W4MAU4_9BACT|nr:MAG: hypothetical protein ETSY2_12105 [Candidatus Entotheonella gemina]